MDLWIKTQKEGLHKIIGINNPIELRDCYELIGYNEHKLIKLGTYESKERALEVLDEIQNFIQNNNNEAEYIHSNTELVLRTTEKLDRNVYVMPEE